MKLTHGIIITLTILSMYISLCIIERSAWFTHRMQSMLTNLVSDNLKCDAKLDLQYASLLTHSAHITALSCTSSQPDQWSMKMSNISVSFSWLTLILKQKFALTVTIEQSEGASLLANNHLAIEAPIRTVLFAQNESLPLYINQMTVHKGSLLAYTLGQSIEGGFFWSSTMHKYAHETISAVTIHDSFVTVRQQPVVTGMHGTIKLTASHGTVSDVQSTLTWYAPELNNEKFNLFGDYRNGHGSWKLSSTHGSLKCTDLSLTMNPIPQLLLTGSVEPHNIKTLLPATLSHVLRGTCTFSLSAQLLDTGPSIHGEIDCADIGIKHLSILQHAHISFDYANNLARGALSFNQHKHKVFKGEWSYNTDKKTGSLSGTNPDKATVNTYWNLKPHELMVEGTIDPTGIIIHHTAQFSHTKTGALLNQHGDIEVAASRIRTHGKIGSYLYGICVRLKPQLSIEEGFLHEGSQDKTESIITLQAKNRCITTTMNYSLINKMLPENIRSQCIGNGMIFMKTCYDDDHISNSITLEKGSIFLGQTHNMVTGLTGSLIYDKATCILTIPQLALSLYRGCITINSGVIRFDGMPGMPQSYTLPCCIENCFIGTQHLSALIDGNCMIDSEPHKAPILSGAITINKGCITNNILSTQFSKDASSAITRSNLSFFVPDIQLDCIIKNGQAIKVRTGTLSAEIAMDLAVRGTASQPDITGSLHLVHGNINLPSTVLRITHGSVHFVAGQPFEPRIEMTARGFVKRYNIMLGVSGTPEESSIRLESMPVLAEEQIGSLLLAGTEDASLNIVVPAIVANNLKTILFGSEYQSASTHQKWYHRLLKPLRHISLLPLFTDQTGRDGFKAAIEINVSDRLNARIEKNFSSTEDTSWEIDYRMTDDLSTKIIRDEHGDLGGEAEMRWKF